MKADEARAALVYHGGYALFLLACMGIAWLLGAR